MLFFYILDSVIATPVDEEVDKNKENVLDDETSEKFEQLMTSDQSELSHSSNSAFLLVIFKWCWK